MPESELPTFNPPPSARRLRFQRLLSILAIVSCCGFIACAGCCFLTSIFFGPKNFDTPAGAEQVAVQITDWTLPNNFVGKSGAVMDNFLMRFEIARFAQQHGRGKLILAQLHYKLLPGADLHTQLQEIVENLVPDLKKIDVSESESRSPTINRVASKFEVIRGEDLATTTKYRRVIGHFRGKLDNSIVILECEEEFLTEQEIDDFIKSIH